MGKSVSGGGVSGKGPEQKDLVSSGSGKFSMSEVTSPKDLQFEEFILFC